MGYGNNNLNNIIQQQFRSQQHSERQGIVNAPVRSLTSKQSKLQMGYGNNNLNNIIQQLFHSQQHSERQGIVNAPVRSLTSKQSKPQTEFYLQQHKQHNSTPILFSRSLISFHRSYVRRSLSNIINVLHTRNNTASGKGK